METHHHVWRRVLRVLCFDGEYQPKSHYLWRSNQTKKHFRVLVISFLLALLLRVSIYTIQNVASRMQRFLVSFFWWRKLNFVESVRFDTYRIDKPSLMASSHRKEVMAKIVKFHEKGGPEVLKLEEVTLLSVAENDVRFRVHAIG